MSYDCVPACGSFSGFCDYTFFATACYPGILYRRGCKHILSATQGNIFVSDTNNSCSTWSNSGQSIHNIAANGQVGSTGPSWRITRPIEDIFGERGSQEKLDEFVVGGSIIYDSEPTTRCWRHARLCMCVQNATIIKSGLNGSSRNFDFSKATIEWVRADVEKRSQLPFNGRPFKFPDGRNFMSRHDFKSYCAYGLPSALNDGRRLGVCSKLGFLFCWPDEFIQISGTRAWCVSFYAILYAEPNGNLSITYMNPRDTNCVDEDYTCRHTGCELPSNNITDGIVLDYTRFESDALLKRAYYTENNIDYKIAGVYCSRLGGTQCDMYDTYTFQCEYDEHGTCTDRRRQFKQSCKDDYLYWNTTEDNYDIASKLSSLNLLECDLGARAFFYPDNPRSNFRPPPLGTAFDFIAVFDIFKKATLTPGSITPSESEQVYTRYEISDEEYYCTDLMQLYAHQLVPVPPK